jgi:hypothetical protein
MTSDSFWCGEWTAKEEAKPAVEDDTPGLEWLMWDCEGNAYKITAIEKCTDKSIRMELVRAPKDCNRHPDLAPQPVAYCIQCEPGDPKVHSLSFDKASLERIVTRHGGKIVGLYLREQAS